MDNELSGERSSNPEEMRETLKEALSLLGAIASEHKLMTIAIDEAVLSLQTDVREVQLPKRR